MQRQGEVICLPAICRSSQRVDLQREGEPFDSSPLIVSAAALRGNVLTHVANGALIFRGRPMKPCFSVVEERRAPLRATESRLSGC